MSDTENQDDGDERESFDDWMEGHQAAIESGQSSISAAEAERRYYSKYGKRFRTHSPED